MLFLLFLSTSCSHLIFLKNYFLLPFYHFLKLGFFFLGYLLLHLDPVKTCWGLRNWVNLAIYGRLQAWKTIFVLLIVDISQEHSIPFCELLIYQGRMIFYLLVVSRLTSWRFYFSGCHSCQFLMIFLTKYLLKYNHEHVQFDENLD